MNIVNVLLYVFTYFFVLYRKNLVESTGSQRIPPLKPPDFKLFTSDGVQESEIQQTEYQHKQLGLVGNIHEFKLKDEANCSKVKQDDSDVWIKSETDTLINFSSQPSDTDSGQQSSADSTLTDTSTPPDAGAGVSVKPGHKYPIKIVYNTRAKVIWIIFEDGYLGYMLINGKWTFKIRRNIPSDRHEHIASANLEATNPSSSTDSRSPTHETTQSELPISNLYPTDYSAGNAGFPYPESDESTPVDSSLYLLGLGSASVRVPSFFGQTSSLSRGQKKPSLRGIPDHEEAPNIKIFTTSDTDPNSIVELSSDKYSVQYYENIKSDYFIELKHDSKCTLVKCEDMEVWKEGDHDLNEPTSMDYYKSYSHMVVRDYDKGVIYNEKDEKWNHYATVYYRKDRKKKAPSVTRPTADTVTQQSDVTTSEHVFISQEATETAMDTLTVVSESTSEITTTLSASSTVSSEIKFYVADPSDASNNVEMDSSGYNLTESANVSSYQFNKECTKFIFDDVLMWQHDPNERDGKHPMSLVYDKTEETFVLKFEGLDINFAKNTDGMWEYTETDTSAGGSAATTLPDPSVASTQPQSSVSTPASEDDSSTVTVEDGSGQPGGGAPATPAHQPGSSTQSKVKLLKANASDPNNPLELEANDCTSTQSGNEVSYQIAAGVKCVQLIFDNVLLWVYDSTKHGGKYPKSVVHDTTTDIIVLTFDGLDITFQKTADQGWIYTESGPLAVKFHLTDPNDSTKTVELTSNQLTVSTNGDVTTFNIANGVNSTVLTYGPVLLWEHDPTKYDGKHPKSLDFTTSSETLVLKFEEVHLSFAKNNGQWEYTENDTSSRGSATTQSPDPTGASTQPQESTGSAQPGGAATPPPAETSTSTTQPDPSDSTPASEDDSTTVTVEDGSGQPGGGAPATPAPQSGSSTQSKVKLLKANASDPNNPLELATNEYTLTQSGNVDSYQIAAGVKCVQLIFDTVLLWAHEPNQRGGKYPKSVVHDTTTDIIVLTFDGLDITFQKTADQGWIYTESGPLAVKFHLTDPNDSTKTVELTSNQLTVSTNGDVTTFNIANGVNSTVLTYGPVLLWEHDPTKYDGKHPKSLDFTTSSETLVLKFEEVHLSFAKNNGQWEYTEDTSGT